MNQKEKYKVLRKLDAGGMAEVYEAVAEGLEGFQKKVAIKRVLPHLAENKKFISMFLDEARLSLYLSHANVVQVFDIGQAGGTYFIVMEFVDGSNLRNLMQTLQERGRVLPIEQCIYIVMEMCRGLSYAHSIKDVSGRHLGIVHRDVSPPNVLLSKQGEVKIVDFGLAKASSQLETTDPGVVKGKYAYLSPEAAKGLPVDKRMDVFGCGIVLYEMITGQRLFLGKNDVDTIHNVRNAHVPSMSQINSMVAPELEQVIRKALAREPANRFQSCDQLAEALANYLFSARLKVTGFDLKRTLDSSIDPGKNKDAQSIIDKFIQEEVEIFSSLGEQGGPIYRNQSNYPLSVSGALPQNNYAPSAGNPGTPSPENMIDGQPQEHSLVQEQADQSEQRQLFFVGLSVALAVATLIIVIAWLLGFIG